MASNEPPPGNQIRPSRKFTKPSDCKIFKDAIDDTIQLHPLLVAIIDTPQFQRLRGIKQLGLVDFVYPGATHTRFEHSIGVAHLAGEYIRAIKNNHGDDAIGAAIGEHIILSIEVAAVCYSMGHGPMSYVFRKFMMRGDPNYSFNETAVSMFNNMLADQDNKTRVTVAGTEGPKEEEMQMEKLFGYYGLGSNEIEFIRQIIENKTPKPTQEFPLFLYKVVNNRETGNCAKDWDYVIRDCHHTGMKMFVFDYKRYLQTVRIINGEICCRDKLKENILQFLQTKENLYRQIYLHSAVQNMDSMMIRAMVMADTSPFFKTSGDDKCRLSECVKYPEVFVKLKDSFLEKFDHIEQINQILNRIHRRNLFQYMGKTRSEGGPARRECEYEKSMVDKMKQKFPADKVDWRHMITITVAKFLLAPDGGNPFDALKFYKLGMENESFPLTLSSTFPTVTSERILRFYLYSEKGNEWSRSHYDDFIEAFKEWCEQEEGCTEPLIR